MAGAHRPTFDPAQGKEALRGAAYHTRMQPAHTHLKTRQPGQGTTSEASKRDLRAQLLEAEAKHYKKPTKGAIGDGDRDDEDAPPAAPKRLLEGGSGNGDTEEGSESIEAKRRRVLEETRDIDADDDDEEDDEEDDDSDEESEEDETAELMREMAKIKRERAEQREKEEREKAAQEEKDREKDIAFGNPLLNPKHDYGLKRRWDDDVVFKNQARGTEDKRKPEFINDTLRSDFHKRFMSKYVR